MNLPIKILLGVGGTGVTAASGYGIYELTRPKTIGEKLLWEGKTLLKTDGTEDDEKWTSIYNKHKEEKTTTDKFTLTGSPESKDSLKTKCKEVLSEKLSETTSTTDLNKARYWCVKDSTKLTEAKQNQ